MDVIAFNYCLVIVVGVFMGSTFEWYFFASFRDASGAYLSYQRSPMVSPQTNGSKPSLSLPIINISPYFLQASPKVESQRAAVSAAIHAACRDFGFFYLDISAIVDPREPEELTELAREFFNSPQEEKDKISLSIQDHARGA